MLKLLRFGLYALVALGAVLLLSGAGLWAGYQLNDAMQNRFSLPSQIHYKLNGYYNSFFNTEEVAEDRVITNRLLLQRRTVFLPLEASDFAGGIAPHGRDTLLVTDRLGRLFALRDGQVTALNIAAPDNHAEALRQQLEAGQLGAIEIDFNWFRYNDILSVPGGTGTVLLLSYSEWDAGERCYRSALARLDLPGEDPAIWRAGASDWQVIQRTEPCLKPFASGKGIYGLEAGGRLDRLGGNRIVWTSGSYEWDDRFEGTDFSKALAQDDGSDYGKVMIVDLAAGQKETISKGLRNPQGVSVDRAGRIWVTDHGMRGGDELNLAVPGANFGFPAVSYGTKYNRQPAGNGPRHAGHDGYDLPVAAFVPSIAPAAALALEGFHEAWDGDILVGALSGSLNRVHVVEGRAAYVEPIELGVRIRDLARLEDGATIAVYTDDRRVIYLTPDGSADPILTFNRSLAAHTADPSLRAAVDSTFTACLQCHGLLPGEMLAGPSLHGICDRAPGALAFDGASGALPAIGSKWDKALLQRFIADPATVAPETTMAWGGIEDAETAATLATVLCDL